MASGTNTGPTVTITAARHRLEQKAAWDRKAAGVRAEVGPIPPVLDPDRRAECRESFRRFCEVYRAPAFFLSWSPDHIEMLRLIETTVRDGGLFAFAMPRAAGKTTICVTAGLWALLYGHRRWVCMIGATADAAADLVDSMKVELTFNDLLFEDFPEITAPIRHLGDKAARVAGQTVEGRLTNMIWLSDEIVLPTVAGSIASGGVVTCTGIKGRIRGQNKTTTTGEVDRPDYILLDDPQTRQSSNSAKQNDDRVIMLNGDILGLAGPTKKISGVMPCTVINRNDMADRVLNDSPEWHGKRTKLLNKMPTNMKLWDTYQEIRDADFRNDGDGSEATDFYAENREAMDAGAEAAWAERFFPSELSAIQNCMNLFFRDEVVFAAEYQNEPLDVRFDESLTIDEIASRANGYERGIVPTSCETLTGFIDVQQNLLYWCICAWQKNFTGYVIDYGAWPDQRALNFRYSQAKNTIAKRFPGLSIEAGLRKSLDELITELTARTFKRDDGTEMQVNRLLVDGQWQTDIVYAACRENPSSANLYPARGKFVGATTDPLNERQKRAPGKTIGVHWRIEKSNRGPIRQVLADSNYWKSFIHSRLSTDPAERGSLTLYLASSKHHKTFAAHMKAEYSVRAEGRGRVVDEWKLRADRPDNHWLDCLSGCAIAASIEGCTLAELGSNSPAVKKVRKHRDRDERVAYL